MAGESLALPIGVHLANGRRGSFIGDLAVSIAGQALAVGLYVLTRSGPMYVVGSVAQVALVIANERTVARKRLEAQP
jgi:hypothetical protein